MFKNLAMLGVVAVAIAAGVFGIGGSSTEPAHAAPMNGLVLSQSTCFLIGTAFGGGAAIECADPANVSVLAINTNLDNFASRLANRPIGTQRPSYSDFQGIDLDKNQLHEKDGTFFVVIFLDDTGPVEVTTENASIRTSNTTAAGEVGHHFICDTAAPSTNGDPDCVASSLPSQDGALVFAVHPDANTVRGPGLIHVVQNRVPLDLPFTVVGEVHSVALVALKSTLATGATDTGGKTTADTADDCKLPGAASGFLAANATSPRTVLLGVAKDSDGTAITGVSIYWSSDDPDIAVATTNFTPTLDLGSSGVAAPNILCGRKTPGTTTIRMKSVSAGPADTAAKGIIVDPAAPEIPGSTDVTVVGQPASLTAAAAPASIPCDGVATSTVSATVVDAGGNLAADGTDVTFSVQTLGIASPINAKTAKGIATSTITPLTLGNGETGVSVNVTTTNITTGDVIGQDVLVACTGGAAAGAPPPPGEVPPGGGAGAGTSGPIGTIQGPNTGSGGLPAGTGPLSWWPLLGLVLAAAGLGAGRVALARIEARLKR